jgi:hypothetical protein
MFAISQLDRRIRRLCLSLLIILLITLAQGLQLGLVKAGDLTVCAQGCDFETLQAAINASSVPAGTVIQLLDEVYTEAAILVEKDLILSGLGPQDTIVQAAAEPKSVNERVFFIAPGTSVTIRDMTIRHGNPTIEPESGGGIRNEGTLILENVVIRDNSASAGGGILNDGTLTMINCTVADNEARGGGSHYTECKTGGGIKNMAGEMTLINTTVRNNHAEAKGGGIHVACNGTLTLMNSTISGNYSASDGGGIFLNGVGIFTHSTISQNEAKSAGGVSVEGSGEVGLVRGQLSFTNTLIAGNTARMEKYGVADCFIGSHASIALNAGNWVGDGNCDAAFSGDPQLTTLTDQPTAEAVEDQPNYAPQVHLLMPESPVVNLLSPEDCKLEVDQWGTSRPQGAGCEIGAYELPQQVISSPKAGAMLLLSVSLVFIVVALAWFLGGSRIQTR